jgi:hypothetical protein
MLKKQLFKLKKKIIQTFYSLVAQTNGLKIILYGPKNYFITNSNSSIVQGAILKIESHLV